MTCCKGCDKRHPGCHGHCEDYAAGKARDELWKAQMRKELDIQRGLDEVEVKAAIRAKRKRRLP